MVRPTAVHWVNRLEKHKGKTVNSEIVSFILKVSDVLKFACIAACSHSLLLESTRRIKSINGKMLSSF